MNSAKKQNLPHRKQSQTASVGPKPSIPPPAPHWTQRPLWTVLAYVFGLLPLCLLWHGNNAFYLDWKNHLWLIGYNGEYFRRHWTFPITLNTEQLSGLPFPIFYGYLFYPAAGLISAFTGSSFAMRLICSLVFLLQVRQVNKTVEMITGNRLVACAVTILVSFATYPLTNLYNRTAIPEFVAASLVLSVCMMWLRIVQMDDSQRRRRLTFGAALTLAFAMGTHPITAILGGSIVGLLIFTCRSRNLSKTLGVAAALIAVVMAPWIYAVACFGRKVQLSGGWIYVFTNSIDRFLTRFSPLPWDPRTGHPELNQLGTSYLDAQINFALLILAVYLLYRTIRQRDTNDLRQFHLALAAFAGFVLVTFASLSQWFWSLMPNALKFIQFSYRLVTYADLFLLFTVLFLLAAGTRRVMTSPDRPLIAALAVCLMFSTASVGLKLIHAHRVEEPNVQAGSGWKDTNRDALRSLPSSFYGVNGYAVKSEARGTLPPGKTMLPISIPIGLQERFGEALPIPIFTNIYGVIRTNVQIFPWNHLVWNGREIPPEEIATNQELITILPGKPGAGTLAYVLRPDPVWVALRFLSLWTAAIWAAALSWYYFRTRKKTGSESTPPGFLT